VPFKPDTLQLEVTGGTTGFVRNLWKLDASEKSTAAASTLLPQRMRQVETYSSRAITTFLAFDRAGVTSLRILNPPDPDPPRKQIFLFPDIRDLLTSWLYVRSQRLQPGDSLTFVAFPARDPYLASLRVFGKDNIRVAAGRFNALKVEVRLQKINNQRGLEPNRKFKRAVAWISNDDNRLILRVEAEIFVGSIWAELQSVKFTAP
jgi:hypothetical protein